jgi:hypothetical protein
MQWLRDNLIVTLWHLAASSPAKKSSSFSDSLGD